MNFKVWTESTDTRIAIPHTVSADSLEEALADVECHLAQGERLVSRRHDVEVQPGVWVSVQGLVEFALNADTGAVYRGLVSRMSRGVWRPNDGRRPLLERFLHRSCLRLG